MSQCERIGKLGVFEGKTPNHVLVNEYLAGQGIMVGISQLFLVDVVSCRRAALDVCNIGLA